MIARDSSLARNRMILATSSGIQGCVFKLLCIAIAPIISGSEFSAVIDATIGVTIVPVSDIGETFDFLVAHQTAERGGGSTHSPTCEKSFITRYVCQKAAEYFAGAWGVSNKQNENVVGKQVANRNYP